jgi:hypothetical protein
MLGIVVELGDVVIDTEQLSNLLAGLDGDAKDEPPFVALEVKGQVACFESRIHVSFILASSPGGGADHAQQRGVDAHFFAESWDRPREDRGREKRDGHTKSSEHVKKLKAGSVRVRSVDVMCLVNEEVAEARSVALCPGEKGVSAGLVSGDDDQLSCKRIWII